MLGCGPRCFHTGVHCPLLVARCEPGSAGAGTALGTEGLPQDGHGAQHRWLAATQMAICSSMDPCPLSGVTLCKSGLSLRPFPPPPPQGVGCVSVPLA